MGQPVYKSGERRSTDSLTSLRGTRFPLFPRDAGDAPKELWLTSTAVEETLNHSLASDTNDSALCPLLHS